MGLWDKFKEELGKGFDQVNVLDGGKSYKTREIDASATRGWDRIKDTFDANSTADKASRVSKGRPELYEDDQTNFGYTRDNNSVGKRFINTLKSAGEGATESYRYLGKGLGESLAYDTEPVKEGRETQQRNLDDWVAGISKADKYVKDESLDYDTRNRWYKYQQHLKNSIAETQGQQKQDVQEFMAATDPIKGAASVVSIGADIATAGVGTSGIKGAKTAFQQGTKEGVKELATQGVKTGVTNLPNGFVDPFVTSGADTTAGQVALSTGAGFVLGSIIPSATYGGSKVVNNSKNKIAQLFGDKADNFKVKDYQDGVKTSAVDPSTAGYKAPEKSVIQLVDPNTGKKQFIMPEDANYDAIKKQIDDARDGTAIAGQKQADGTVPHLTSKTPEQMKANGFKRGTTAQIKDLLPNLEARQKAALAVDPVKDMATKAGVKEDTVQKLIKQYGEDNTSTILARASDATNIRNMDAFVVSEARKAYGSPTVKITQSAEELDSLYKTAPEAPLKVTQPVQTPNTVKVTNPIPLEESQLGKIAENMYDSVKGQDAKIGYTALEDLGNRVSKQIDNDFAQIGSDFPTVSRKVQEAIRNGAKTIDEVDLTPDEKSLLKNVQDEMNYIRRRASLGRKEVGEGNFGDLYLPQQKQGQFTSEDLYKGFRDTAVGNEKARKNLIDLDEMDYSSQVVGQYITRYGDTKAYKQQRIFNGLKRNNPNVDENVVAEAAQQVMDVQDKVNKLKTKITAIGFGTRKTLSDGEYVDTAAELADIGKKLKGEQIDIIEEASGLTNGDKINSVKVGDTPIGDYVGMNQYRDSGNYAAKQFVESAGNKAELARMVELRLREAYDLSDETIEYITGGISRMPDSVPDQVVLGRVTSSYQMAAKQQMLENLQKVNIKSDKLRRTVSDLTNQILREGSIEQQASAKVVSKVLSTTNAVFRKLNVGSAINELGDITSFASYFGKDFTPIPNFKFVREFGLGDIDAAIEPFIKQVEAGKSWKTVAKSINEKTNLYRFVEAYKAGVVANSSAKAGKRLGLEGDDLVQKVLSDYRDVALPVDAFTKTVLDNAPLYTQYMTWGVRNLQKEGRLATGKLKGGSLTNKTRMERAARNAYVNLPAKTVFWLSSNALKGTAILTAFGLTDFTGMTSGDFSGIQEEDKSLFDRTTQFTNASTIMSLTNTVVQSLEKENLKDSDKYKDADYNPYENNSVKDDVIGLFRPSVERNITQSVDLMNKGYSENKNGRVQYEAPEDPYNIIKSFVFGKNQTANAREYSGRENIVDRVQDGQNPLGAAADMAQEQLNIKDRNYNRPLTDDYTEEYKAVEEGARTALLEGGRKYNKYLDDLKRNDKESYDRYISSLDGNHVNPEYWKEIAGDEGTPNLDLFKTLGDRKKQQMKDLGEAYDPLYDLPDDQARQVLQQKSAATGDDIALRNNLYKEQWYQEYMDKVSDYYQNKEEFEGGDREQTERVKNWYALSDQYNDLRRIDDDEGNEPAWSKEFPIVYASKIVNDQYGFDSDESKEFFKAYGDQYREEKKGYEAANLELINQMRAIEGYPAMSAEQYAQAKSIENTDPDENGNAYGSAGYNKYGSSGGSSSSSATNKGLKTSSFGSAKSAPSIKVSSKKNSKSVKIKKRNSSKKIKLKT